MTAKRLEFDFDNSSTLGKSEDWWRAREAEIDAKNEERAKRDEEAEAKQSAHRLLLGGAPELAVEGVYSERFNESCEGMQALADLRGDGSIDSRRIRILAGGVGCGKTWAAIRWLGDHGGSKPIFRTAHEFETIGRYDREETEKWKTCTAMILDDLGSEYADGKGNWTADLEAIIDSFTGRRAWLVITTNLTGSEFKLRHSARVLSRLRQHGVWKQLHSSDRRGQK